MPSVPKLGTFGLPWLGLALVLALGVGLAGCSGPSIYYDGSARPRVEGETRALVIWMRFSDDMRDLSGAATEAQRDWAVPDRLPRLAHEVLSTSARRPRGLTEYFLSQSQGKFKLTGRSYPSVIVSEAPEVDYLTRNGTLDQGRLTKELLDHINADPRFDLEDFDADRDGFIDYVFVVVRGMSATRLYPTHASGVSDLGYTSEVPEFGRRGRLKLDRHQSGSYVRYDDAGNIFAEMDLVRLMAHEIGHDLWTDWVHLRPLRPFRGVPSLPSRQVGYALMAGGSDARGDETISAYEREALGWISCAGLATDTVFVLRDLYSARSGNCFTMAGAQFRVRSEPRQLYLSFRERIGPFDIIAHEDAPQARSDQGLMDTGVLVMATEPFGRVGPVPADGELGLSPHASAYSGDLFKAGERLTPWTVPNSVGLLGFPAGLIDPPASIWQGLHFLRRDGDGMRIHYRPDERRGAVFYDGDVLPALPDLSFQGTASVRGMVTILGDAAFLDSLTVTDSAVLIVNGTATVGYLELVGESTLRVSGTLDVTRVLIGPLAKVFLADGASVRGDGAAAVRSASR